MKRRDFLKVGGTAGAGGLLLQGCGSPDEQLIPLLVSEDQFIPGEEGWVASFCQLCPAGCGISVRVMQGESVRTVDGRTVRVKAAGQEIEGSARHPLNLGKTARGQAGLQALPRIDPGPLRHRARGAGQHARGLDRSAEALRPAPELQNTPESGSAHGRAAAPWAP
jgi:anaerobic selenocysteine-containing dehydrogenase